MPEHDSEKRKAWFEWYLKKTALGLAPAEPVTGDKQRCPCCRCLTLSARASFIICPVCFWEDDGQDDPEADVVRGGANARLSLTAARQNYLRYGACDPKFLPNVRPPLPEETDTEYSI
jgi:hypothetical protein